MEILSKKNDFALKHRLIHPIYEFVMLMFEVGEKYHNSIDLQKTA